ncbi:Serine/threonine-protein kinase MRCK gamma [Frankliniella fusca]|uniref:Serine/threonine-protein kinase MRCK gamma n=1 Tax=Frankliniella fusca TaxID=407009 RepID=A0AAE1H254_9NEOP|nr:Serine/threonine-protein kinase MRCK gamma [Frankliniella fusca]
MTKEKEAALSGLIAGYLDVKLPARTRRRRFGTWKSWRRHWVEARLVPDDGSVDLVLSPARSGAEAGAGASARVIRVPGGASTATSVCRTASRSRGHAFVIASAAAAGAEQTCDVYLATRSEADTDRWIGVLVAALSGRRLGLAAAAEHAAAVVGAPPAPSRVLSHAGHAAAGTASALLRGRRLSRSEGDLLAAGLGAVDLLPTGLLGPGLRVPSPGEVRREVAAADAACKTSTLGRLGRSSPARAPHRQPFRLLYGRRRADTLRADDIPDPNLLSTSPQSTSGSALSLLGGKIANGLISAGLGLMLSTPGGSEVEDNDADNDADEDDVGPAGVALPAAVAALALDRRRESAVSVASGIYEEIPETSASTAPGTPVVVIDRVYENAAVVLAANGHDSHYEDPALLFSPRLDADGKALQKTPRIVSPPPLPPRQNLTPLSEMLTRTNGHVYSCVDADLASSAVDANGYVQMGQMRTSARRLRHLQAELQAELQAACLARRYLKTPSPPPGPGAGPAAERREPGSSEPEPEPTYLPMSPIRPPLLLNDSREQSS